jgi:hypothetical protein
VAGTAAKPREGNPPPFSVAQIRWYAITASGTRLQERRDQETGREQEGTSVALCADTSQAAVESAVIPTYGGARGAAVREITGEAG